MLKDSAKVISVEGSNIQRVDIVRDRPIRELRSISVEAMKKGSFLIHHVEALFAKGCAYLVNGLGCKHSSYDSPGTNGTTLVIPKLCITTRNRYFDITSTLQIQGKLALCITPAGLCIKTYDRHVRSLLSQPLDFVTQMYVVQTCNVAFTFSVIPLFYS